MKVGKFQGDLTTFFTIASTTQNLITNVNILLSQCRVSDFNAISSDLSTYSEEKPNGKVAEIAVNDNLNKLK